MTYKETVAFLFEQLPQFQNIGSKAYNGKLDNIIDICELLDNPQNKFKTIHVAGTNGKGSVCNMLASILTQSGYTVGLFTSPHLLDFRERIRINGEVIQNNYVIDFVKNKQLFSIRLNLPFLNGAQHWLLTILNPTKLTLRL